MNRHLIVIFYCLVLPKIVNLKNLNNVDLDKSLNCPQAAISKGTSCNFVKKIVGGNVVPKNEVNKNLDSKNVNDFFQGFNL